MAILLMTCLLYTSACTAISFAAFIAVVAYCPSANRTVSGVEPLDFFKIKELTFIEPDFNRYPNLKLAIDAFAEGQYATTAMNAANEIAVQAFLDGYIKFTDIAKINQAAVEQMPASTISSIDDVLALDKQARELAASLIKKLM